MKRLFLLGGQMRFVNAALVALAMLLLDYRFVIEPVKIPYHSFLYDPNQLKIVAMFEFATSLSPHDPRLANTIVVPYWTWPVSTYREYHDNQYSATFSIMGSATEALDYRAHGRLPWGTSDIRTWENQLLEKFERDCGPRIDKFTSPYTAQELVDFQGLLSDWYDQYNDREGIHLVVAALWHWK